MMSSPTPQTHKKLINISIRPATVADVPIMARQQVDMALSTENRDLTPTMLHKGLTLGLNQQLSYVQLFVAETKLLSSSEQEENEDETQQKEICGMIMIRPEFFLLRNSSVFSLEDVFTEEKYRGKGVFRTFFNQIRDTQISSNNNNNNSIPRDFCGMRLFVDKENDSAIAVYKKVGMYLEKGRPFRWCKIGSEAPRKDPSEEEKKRMAITPLSTRNKKNEDDVDHFGKECIHRLSSNNYCEKDCNNDDEETIIETLTQMIWSNSRKYHRFANDDDENNDEAKNFDRKFNIDTLRSGVKRAIQSQTSIVTAVDATDTKSNNNNSKDLPVEFYIIRRPGKNSEIIGCFMLTFEFCTWRRGFIIWVQSFSVNNNNNNNNNSPTRGFIFRSVIRWVQRKVEEDKDVEEDTMASNLSKIPFSGVRFELDPELENSRNSNKNNKNNQEEEEENLVKVAEEEAFEFEDDVQMRIEL